MLDKALIPIIVDQLHNAEYHRSQISQLSLAYPQITIDDAYEIQRQWIIKKLANGHALMGHKVGLTSMAMRRAANITEPDFGVLLDNMFFDPQTIIPIERFIVPRIEVELAFILDQPLSGPNCTIFDVLEATAWIMPALEIIDARIEHIDQQSGAPRKVFDTIADNAANAGVILGGHPTKPNDIDLCRIGALLYRNGIIEESGVSAAVLNHPANAVAWLANKLNNYQVTLDAGQVILSGAFTRPISLTAGDIIHADYGVLGTIACRFA